MGQGRNLTPPTQPVCLFTVGESDKLAIEHTRTLFREYQSSLNEDLCFQNFCHELANLHEKYGGHHGCIILACKILDLPNFWQCCPWLKSSQLGSPEHPASKAWVTEGTHFEAAFHSGVVVPVGCVALHPLEPQVIELKRLYVRPDYRGLKLGRFLTEYCIHRAISLGHRAMRLDTLGRLVAAVNLYHTLGFREIPPYTSNPLPDVIYLELELLQHANTSCFDRLSDELLLHILSYLLSPSSLASAARVSRRWRRLAADNSLWAALHAYKWHTNPSADAKQQYALQLQLHHAQA